MSRYFYHNLTKNWFNETDLCDAVEKSDSGDVIKLTDVGCALVVDLSENQEVYDRFNEYFQEFHGRNFNLST